MWNRRQRYRHEYQQHQNSHEETSNDACKGSNYHDATRLIRKTMTKWSKPKTIFTTLTNPMTMTKMNEMCLPVQENVPLSVFRRCQHQMQMSIQVTTTIPTTTPTTTRTSRHNHYHLLRLPLQRGLP